MKSLLIAALVGIAYAESSVVENAAPALVNEVEAEIRYLEEDDGVVEPVYVDEARVAELKAVRNLSSRRKLYGDVGLCLDGISVENGDFVCDPLNELPQICALVCRDGYYSTGANTDIACADAICQGSCKAEKIYKTAYDIQVVNKTCEYATMADCDTDPTGKCLVQVSEPCTTSVYKEKTVESCQFEMAGLADVCKGSGCSGDCNNPGSYYYSTKGCPIQCPPWRDPEVPAFLCSACPAPDLSSLPKSVVVRNIDNVYLVGCDAGYWGAPAYKLACDSNGNYNIPSYDGEISCKSCAAAPEATAPNVVRVIVDASDDTHIGVVQFQCAEGYEGTPTTAKCDDATGQWPEVVEQPTCVLPAPVVQQVAEVAPSPSASASASPVPSSSASPIPSASKTPRPPKGSRAPTAIPKVRKSAPGTA